MSANFKFNNSIQRWNMLFFIVPFFILLLWLLMGMDIVIRSSTKDVTFPFMEFFIKSLLGMVVTCILILLGRKFQRYSIDSEKVHRILFKKNPHPMWVYDLKTLRFLNVNDAAIAFYGYSEDEFLEMSISDIRPQEDVPAIINSTERIRLNFNHQYHWPGTWRHKKKNGQLMYVEISSHEILFDKKKSELVLAYDVTEKINQEQKLQTLNQDLERRVMFRTNDQLQLNKRLIDQNKIIKSANLELFTLSNELQEANLRIQEHADLKSRFVAMASHEFRTPLANITFSAGFIRHHFNKLEPQNIITKLQGIETHVAHMAALLDDVLTIGKTDASTPEINRRLLDLNDFVSAVSQEVQTASNNSHLLHINVNENVPPYLHTDEKFLRNIVINLLNNAIKYSHGQRDVYVNIYITGHETYFEVTDMGQGIHEQDLEKIFEPFYRAKGLENIQGTGLGLSIVKRAVDLLGAKIHVRSKIGEGSTFTIVLPAEETLNS